MKLFADSGRRRRTSPNDDQSAASLVILSQYQTACRVYPHHITIIITVWHLPGSHHGHHYPEISGGCGVDAWDMNSPLTTKLGCATLRDWSPRPFIWLGRNPYLKTDVMN